MGDDSALIAARAQALLSDLSCRGGLEVPAGPDMSGQQRWMDSHLADLIGRRERIMACDVPLPECADAAMLAFNNLLPPEARLPWLGRRVLGMRRLTHPLRRGGPVSPSGSCQLLPCRDGVLAVNLPRPEDWDSLPAWLESAAIVDWASLGRALRQREASDLLERSRWLGLAVAPAHHPPEPAPWMIRKSLGQARTSRKNAVPRVLDFSALWAGPLASALFVRAGAEVTKVEHPARPDGARLGPRAFFDTLHAGKKELALDLRCDDQQEQLRRELETTDIVIESFRPRVLPQLGVDLASWVKAAPGRTWISITGYERDGVDAERVAFGDDAAAAAGLSAAMHARSGEWLIVGDAIADPLTGLHAALAAMASFQQGGGDLINVPMKNVVASCLEPHRC